MKKPYTKLLNFLCSCFVKEVSWKEQQEYRVIAFGDYFDRNQFLHIDCEPISFWRWNLKSKTPYQFSGKTSLKLMKKIATIFHQNGE